MSTFKEDFARKISSISDVDGLRNEFAKYMNNAGMRHFSYHIVQHKIQPNLENYYITDYPLEWQDRYLEQSYYNDDPLLNDYQRHTESFAWGANKRIENKKSQQMFIEASDFGLVGGIGIPIPGPDKSFSVVTLSCFAQDINEIRKLNIASGKDLTISALLFHAAIVALNQKNAMHHQYELTNKERECLKWICTGKSYSEIGDIFNLTESAIKKKVRNIYAKMDVSSRHDAVLKAFKYKIVEV